MKTHQLTRRTLLQIGATIPPLMLAACMTPAQTPSAVSEQPTALPQAVDAATASQSSADQSSASQSLVPTPACDDGDDPTPEQTEGPFYTPNTPERSSFLEAGISGTRMIVSGNVLTTACQPVAGAMLDFWHCNDAGKYDNAGFSLRGHFFADAQGHYQLETIVPGVYPGRTRHFHVRVQAPNQPILTTQLYFPNEAENQRDGIFRPECLMDVSDSGDGKLGNFNFVLAVA